MSTTISSFEERDVPKMLVGIIEGVFGRAPDVERIGPLRVWGIDKWLYLQHEPLGKSDNWLVWMDVPEGHAGRSLPCIMQSNRQRTYHKTFWAAALTVVQTVSHMRAHSALEDAARDCGHTTRGYLVTHAANQN